LIKRTFANKLGWDFIFLGIWKDFKLSFGKEYNSNIKDNISMKGPGNGYD